MADETGAGRASSDARLAIGQCVSHYEILEKIGESESGETYLAHDTKLDRRVALKCLSPEVEADTNARNRFLQGAKGAASLHHPCSGVELRKGARAKRRVPVRRLLEL